MGNERQHARPVNLSGVQFFCGLGAILLLVAALLQHNDPDPHIWIPIYLIPTLICLFAISGGMHWSIPIVVSGFAYAGFGLIAIRIFGEQPLFSEAAREMWGLLLIALGLDGLGVLLRLKGRKDCQQEMGVST